MKRFLFVLLAFCLSVSTVSAQTFQAKVNRAELPEGETFLLTLELEGAAVNDAPDLSALNKDFTTYSVSNAYRTNIINGQMSQSRQWNLVLMPNKTGKLTIPAISLGQYRSNPVEITVAKDGESLSPQTQGQNGAQPRFKINGRVDNKTPYVQQQINYTLTLLDTGGLQGEEPVFLTDNDNDWIIKSLGAPNVDSKVINGRSIREIKFQYALFPQKSGKLEIPAVRFNGYYLTKDSRQDPFGRFFNDDIFISGFGMTDVFATKNPVVLKTEPIEIEVRPAVEIPGSWWLPAESVKLYAEFEPANPSFKSGEAVSRHIYLQAEGVIDSQLPEINLAPASGLKQYPEKPQTQMSVENGKIVSLEKITNVYIPQNAGKFILPAVSVPWFNTRSGKVETASLPPLEINVLENTALPQQEIPVPAVSNAEPARVLPADNDEPATHTIEKIDNMDVYLLLAVAFVLGILLSWAVMKFMSISPKNKISKKDIIRNARNKDLKALRDNILEWARQTFGDENIHNLGEVADRTGSKAFSCELDKLTEVLYAQNGQDWDAASFIKAFEKVYGKKYRRTNEDAPLPKLYK